MSTAKRRIAHIPVRRRFVKEIQSVEVEVTWNNNNLFVGTKLKTGLHISRSLLLVYLKNFGYCSKFAKCVSD